MPYPIINSNGSTPEPRRKKKCIFERTYAEKMKHLAKTLEWVPNDEGGNSNVQRRSTKSNLGLAKYNENKFRAATDDDAAEIRAQNLIHKLTE